jgi:hypothetical protein
VRASGVHQHKLGEATNDVVLLKLDDEDAVLQGGENILGRIAAILRDAASDLLAARDQESGFQIQ